MHSIYLDNAATTQPLAGLDELYARYVSDLWHNPSALYKPAVALRQELEKARRSLTNALGSASHRCVFTSGGTESANMVIQHGSRRRKGSNYVCAGFEHPCVEQSFLSLQERGEEVRFAHCGPDGATNVDDIMQVVDENTVLVSVMHVNNETGALNDIEAIAAAVKAKAPRAVFHSDGVQAFLRNPIQDFSNVDYYTVSAHKVHALKGTGAVFYAPKVPLQEMLRGGGQENGLRSGTENVFGILSFAAAAEYFQTERKAVNAALAAARGAFLDEICGCEDIRLVSPKEDGTFAQHIVAIGVAGVHGETLLHCLESDGIYVSTGSACSSKKGKSRTAKALRISEEQAKQMVRLSFSPFTLPDEARHAAKKIKEHAAALRTYQRM